MRFKLLALSAALSLGTGCSWFGLEQDFRDKGEDYKTASSITIVQVPPEYDTSRIRDVFVIPEVPQQVEFVDEDGDFTVPRPTALNAQRDFQRVKIKRLSNRQWVSINVSPAAVWPRLRSWLNQQQLDVVAADPGAGTIETAWLVFNDTPDTKDRFRIHVEPGFVSSMTEIRVEHAQLDREADDALLNWDGTQSNDQRESWLVDQIANVLASQSDAETVSLLASEIGGEPKSAIDLEGATPTLILRVDVDRAWATLASSLNSDTITVMQSRRDESAIDISYTNTQEDDSGWFSGWFGGDEITVESFTLVVTEVGDEVHLTVLGNDFANSRRVIETIRNQID